MCIYIYLHTYIYIYTYGGLTRIKASIHTYAIGLVAIYIVQRLFIFNMNIVQLFIYIQLKMPNIPFLLNLLTHTLFAQGKIEAFIYCTYATGHVVVCFTSIYIQLEITNIPFLLNVLGLTS